MNGHTIHRHHYFNLPVTTIIDTFSQSSDYFDYASTRPAYISCLAELIYLGTVLVQNECHIISLSRLQCK